MKKKDISNFKQVAQILIENGFSAKMAMRSPHISFRQMKILLDIDSSLINENSETRYSPLHCAVVSQNYSDVSDKLAMIAYLLKREVNVNANHTKFGTALHMTIANEIPACGQSHFYAQGFIAEFKIYKDKYKFNWNARDPEGKTVLSTAAKVRSSELVKQILDARKNGADVDVDIQDNKGRTALHFAAALGDTHSANLLILAGADINKTDIHNRSPLHYTIFRQKLVEDILREIEINPDRDQNALRNDNSISIVELSGKSLIKACMEGHVKLFETLLNYSADLDIANSNGNTITFLLNRDCKDFSSNTTQLDRNIASKLKKIIEERQDSLSIKGFTNMSLGRAREKGI